MGKTLEVPKYVVELPSPPPKEYKFTCRLEECGKQFVKLSRLRMHEVIHFSEKPFKCSYSGCNSSYYRQNHLKRHEATRHSTAGGEYKCAFEGCCASFETSLSLYYHNKKKHNEKKYPCSFCSESFTKKFQLKEHESNSHTGVEPFSCTAKGCSEKFTSHANFKSHQKSHKKNYDECVQVPLYTCDNCDDVFDKWSNYIAHNRVAHAKVTCRICNKVLMKSQLRNHAIVHEEERDCFHCPHEGCNKEYYHVKNLMQHIRRAHEGLKFTCDICNKSLSTKQKLELHVQTVHKNKQLDNPTTSGKKTFSREKLKSMLCTDIDFDVTRPGPARVKPSPPKRQKISSSTTTSDSSSQNGSEASGDNSIVIQNIEELSI